MSKSISAKCGHVKRLLRKDLPLTDKTLEFALECLGDTSDDQYLKDVPNKLKAGTPLTEYEYHIFVEVILLHVRLSKPTTVPPPAVHYRYTGSAICGYCGSGIRALNNERPKHWDEGHSWTDNRADVTCDQCKHLIKTLLEKQETD